MLDVWAKCLHFICSPRDLSHSAWYWKLAVFCIFIHMFIEFCITNCRLYSTVHWFVLWHVSSSAHESFQAVNRYKGANYPIMNLHERVLSVLTNKVFVLQCVYLIDFIDIFAGAVLFDRFYRYLCRCRSICIYFTWIVLLSCLVLL